MPETPGYPERTQRVLPVFWNTMGEAMCPVAAPPWPRVIASNAVVHPGGPAAVVDAGVVVLVVLVVVGGAAFGLELLQPATVRMTATAAAAVRTLFQYPQLSWLTSE